MRKTNCWYAGLCIVGLASALQAGNVPDSFTVEDVQKQCEVKPKGGAWQAAKAGEVHPMGSGAKTGAQGQLKISFDNAHMFRLLPNAEVIVTKSTKNAKFREVTAVAELKRGSISVEEVPKDYELKVQTPTAVCGAVGTTYSVRLDSKGEHFDCAEGQIITESRKGTAFKATDISAGKGLTAVIAPGVDNSFSQIDTRGGDMPIAFGGKEDTQDVSEGAHLTVAQHKDAEATVHVNSGKVGKLGKGRYALIKGDKVEEADPTKASAYIEASKKEGKLKQQLDADKTPDPQLQKDLDKAVDDANQAWKELTDSRRAMRDAARGGLNMGGGGMPR